MASLPNGRRGLAQLACLTLLAAGTAMGTVTGAGAGAASAGELPELPTLETQLRALETPKLAIPSGASAWPGCPRLNAQDPAAIQPMRLDPARVALKNRIGCLSMQDAVYGADGCPLRLCGSSYANPIQLPPIPRR